jgi:hypothetical protein
MDGSDDASEACEGTQIIDVLGDRWLGLSGADSSKRLSESVWMVAASMIRGDESQGPIEDVNRAPKQLPPS